MKQHRVASPRAPRVLFTDELADVTGGALDTYLDLQGQKQGKINGSIGEPPPPPPPPPPKS